MISHKTHRDSRGPFYLYDNACHPAYDKNKIIGMIIYMYIYDWKTFKHTSILKIPNVMLKVKDNAKLIQTMKHFALTPNIRLFWTDELRVHLCYIRQRNVSVDDAVQNT